MVVLAVGVLAVVVAVVVAVGVVVADCYQIINYIHD